jgi:NAD+ kinase
MMTEKHNNSVRGKVVGITVAQHKPRAVECGRRLVAALAQRDVQVRASAAVRKSCGDKCEIGDMQYVAESDLVIALGGDGTLLGMARHAAPLGTPLLGIDLGSFGFLAEEDFSHLENGLDALLRGELQIEERLMVRARVMRGGVEFITLIGLNDAVIAKTGIRRMVRLRTVIDGDHIASYPADGLIISTPTGSTAYVLSAGGPLVDPAVECLIVAPICPHTLYSRPLVVRPQAQIEVSAEGRERSVGDASLTLDGQDEVALLPDDIVIVDRAPCNARLVRMAEHSYYERLRRKLKWGAER